MRPGLIASTAAALLVVAACVLWFGVAPSAKVRHETIGNFEMKYVTTDFLGHSYTQGTLSFRDRILAEMVQVVMVSPYDASRIIFLSDCRSGPDDGPEERAKCGLFYFDAHSGKKQKIEGLGMPRWLNWQDANQELPDVWSDDGRFAAVLTNRQLYFVRLQDAEVVDLSYVKNDTGESFYAANRGGETSIHFLGWESGATAKIELYAGGETIFKAVDVTSLF